MSVIWLSQFHMLMRKNATRRHDTPGSLFRNIQPFNSGSITMRALKKIITNQDHIQVSPKTFISFTRAISTSNTSSMMTLLEIMVMVIWTKSPFEIGTYDAV